MVLTRIVTLVSIVFCSCKTLSMSSEECIAGLSKMKSVPRLIPELGLSLGAKDHTNEIGYYYRLR